MKKDSTFLKIRGMPLLMCSRETAVVFKAQIEIENKATSNSGKVSTQTKAQGYMMTHYMVLMLPFLGLYHK